MIPHETALATGTVGIPQQKALEFTDGPVPRPSLVRHLLVASLKVHPSMAKRNFIPSTAHLEQLSKNLDKHLSHPLLVTQDGIIVDGVARWLAAKHAQRDLLPCIILQLSPHEALEHILVLLMPSKRHNAFCRITIALELEPGYSEQARERQVRSRAKSVPSNLTEHRPLDCRKQVADAAGVSTGNVTKVKQIQASNCSPDLMAALRDGLIKIHPAWLLRNMSRKNQGYALKNRASKSRARARGRAALARIKRRAPDEVAELKALIVSLRGISTVPSMRQIWAHAQEFLDAIEHRIPTSARQTNAVEANYQADISSQSPPMGQ